MKPERLLFESAVRAFESLLSEHFWSDLTDLLTGNFAQHIFFVYGPNKIEVSLSSEFFLGQYVNDAMLLSLTPRDASGWPMRPRVCMNDVEAGARFALSAIFGISGTPAADDPHRLLTNLLAEIESRIALLRVHAANQSKYAIVERVDAFEAANFEHFHELMATYNKPPRLFPKTYLRRIFMKMCVSWWG